MNSVSKSMTAFLFLTIAAISAVSVSAAEACTGTAKYRLTVANTATSARFPNIAESLHFSPLTAFTHGSRFTSFILYGYATQGVQNVAETGDNSVLVSELNAAKHAMTGRPALVSVGDVGTNNPQLAFARANFSVTLTATCDYPFVSFISMVAPSPDWIVGATRIRVVNAQGKFVKRVFDRLRVYDAGTDSGETLSAANLVTEPKENIALLEGAPFMGRVVGRYLLEKIM